MKNNKIPFAALFIAAITFLYSLYVSFDITGKFLNDVQLLQLEQYGALKVSYLKNLEFWRLFVFQLIHVKYLHMIYNVISIILLGMFVEPYIGAWRLLLLWFISGVAGTLFGNAFIASPWDLGTGASQAVLGITGLGLVLFFKRVNTSKWFLLALGFSLIPAFALDLMHAGYPKPAHIVSLAIGILVGYTHCKSVKTLS